jgi:hypothetical protein
VKPLDQLPVLFLHRQPAEEAQLHHLASSRIYGRQVLKRIVQRHQVRPCRWRYQQAFIEGNGRPRAAFQTCRNQAACISWFPLA